MYRAFLNVSSTLRSLSASVVSRRRRMLQCAWHLHPDYPMVEVLRPYWFSITGDYYPYLLGKDSVMSIPFFVPAPRSALNTHCGPLRLLSRSRHTGVSCKYLGSVMSSTTDRDSHMPQASVASSERRLSRSKVQGDERVTTCLASTEYNFCPSLDL